MKKYIVLALLIMIALSGLVYYKTDDRSMDKLLLILSQGKGVNEVSRLFQKGFDVNTIDKKGITPLMYASIINPNPDILQLLIEKGADVNAEVNGITTLMFAAIADIEPDVIEMLVRKGADINARNKDGITTLMFAILNNSKPDMITALIKNGADINVGYKESVLVVSSSNNNNLDIIDTQDNNDVNNSTIVTHGLTPLMLAARYSPNPEILRIMLENGADVSLKSSEGKNALDYADENERIKGTEEYKLLR